MAASRSLPTALLVAVAVALATPPASGQQAVDAQTRSAARKLGADGLQLFDAGDYAGAFEKFNLADQLVPAPTLGLRAARCLAKLGRLVEASERYLEVTRMPLDRSALLVHRKAQADALAERDKLLPTIPSLQINIEGPLGGGVIVTIDERTVPPQLLGQRQPVDPGTHKVTVKRADTRVAKNVTLALAGSETVSLTLPPMPPPGSGSGAPGSDKGSTAHVAGVIGVTTGGVGVVVFAINGALALSTQSSLLAKCGPSRDCPPADYGQASSYDTMRAATTVGLVVGVVGFAAGIPLLLTAPSKPDPPRPDRRTKGGATVTPWIGLGGAGLRGRF